MEEFSKNGRKLRPRKTAAADSAHSGAQHAGRPYGHETKPYAPGDRNGAHYGHDERPHGHSERLYNRDERPYGHSERRFNRDNRPYNRESGDERPFRGEGRPSFRGGDRPEGRRTPFQGRRPFGARKRYGAGKDGFNRTSEEGIDRMISRRPQVSDGRYVKTDPVRVEQDGIIRLNKFIANSGVCSRREADTLIQAGVVTVNGEVVTELGVKIDTSKDDVRFNGERLKGEEKVYIVMNKPKGYVTTVSDPNADKTVMDLLKNCPARVFPVGRLDKATTGVLMFTNDGEIAERLTHPSYNKKKIYQVILDRALAEEDKDRILSGVNLNDGFVQADSLEYIDEHDHRKLGIEIHSGKNRIVRRIFESLEYDVRALDRVYFAGLTKRGLKKGEWRLLSEGEVNILKMGAYV